MTKVRDISMEYYEFKSLNVITTKTLHNFINAMRNLIYFLYFH